MKQKLILFSTCVQFLFFSCIPPTKAVTRCEENLAFKEVFMANIGTVDNRMAGKPTADYINALKFLSKYAHVSFDAMLNYARIYDSQEIYQKDREGWLKWYEENKCNNIQFKD